VPRGGRNALRSRARITVDDGRIIDPNAQLAQVVRIEPQILSVHGLPTEIARVILTGIRARPSPSTACGRCARPSTARPSDDRRVPKSYLLPTGSATLNISPVALQPHLTAPQFAEALLHETASDVVDRYILSGPSFVFRQNYRAEERLIRHLGTALSTPEEDVIIVGSAKVGFSLDPNAFPRAFSDDSDLDVAIVSPQSFEAAWRAALEWSYEVSENTDREQAWLKDLRRGVFRGQLHIGSTQHIGGMRRSALLALWRNLAWTWFAAFRDLPREREILRRKVSGRLYRSWDHLRLYHRGGILRLQETLARGTEGATP
jgi:hypothetical protein